jgi:lysophospholipase L1-like esterase
MLRTWKETVGRSVTRRANVREAAAQQPIERSRSLAPLLAVLVVISGCLAFLWAIPPGTQEEVEQTLRPPFGLSEPLGPDDPRRFLATIELPAEWNRAHVPLLTVYEAGAPVGPPRLATTQLEASDPSENGREQRIAFASSDGSDPNANGRAYVVRYARPAVPLPVHLAAVLVATIAGFAFLGMVNERRFAARPRVRRAVLALCSLAFLVALIQWVPAVLLADRLAGSRPDVRDSYDQVFQRGGAGARPGSTANYLPHPYLNFTLNPAAAYFDERQFNERYRIRRKEPIRPRAGVAWRALVLGGSTTFGERTAREEDTWVYRLEQKVREAHGPGYDVVNGGVGGYNIIENLIHYLLLLDALEPDVVVLYVGINDVHPRLMGDLRRDYSNSRLPWRGDEHTLPAANPRLSPLAIYRLLMLRTLERRTLAHIYRFIQRPYPPLREWPASLERNGTGVYRAHLANLVRLVLAQGRQVVIVPQVFVPQAGNETDGVFVRGVAENNAVNEAVAREFGVPFLSPVATAFDRSDLLDNCHFTVGGNEKMAALLFPFLEALAEPARDEKTRGAPAAASGRG